MHSRKESPLQQTPPPPPLLAAAITSVPLAKEGPQEKLAPPELEARGWYRCGYLNSVTVRPVTVPAVFPEIPVSWSLAKNVTFGAFSPKASYYKQGDGNQGG